MRHDVGAARRLQRRVSQLGSAQQLRCFPIRKYNPVGGGPAWQGVCAAAFASSQSVAIRNRTAPRA